jgi:hypothetical protein
VSRNGRLIVADLSVDYLQDVKVRRLRRRHGADAVLAHLATLLLSAKEGERVAVHDAVDDVPEEWVATMVDLDLLDAEGRIPLDSYEEWIAPAVEATKARREAGREYANRRWHGSPNGSPIGSPNETPNTRPSVRPSVRPSAAREADPATGQGRPASRGETPTFDFNAVRPAWMGAKKEPVT